MGLEQHKNNWVFCMQKKKKKKPKLWRQFLKNTIACYEQVHDQEYTEVSDMMFIDNVRELVCF